MSDLKRSFLIAYDQGKIGTLWGVMEACSADEIHALYPELTIVAEPPGWMGEEERQRMAATSYDIDGAPWGLLNALLADRNRP